MYTIKDMPKLERPRERLLLYGAKSLSIYELIAIIIRVGNRNESAIELAKKIVAETNEISDLRDKTVFELSKINGVGKTKAITLLAAIEIGERVLQPQKDKIRISSPSDVFNLLKYELKDLKQEVLIALYLDLKTNLITKKRVFTGSLNQSLIHPREVFKYAIKYSAFQIILVHNHPSGDPSPSQEDLDVTKRFRQIGEMLQIKLLDHVIIGNNTYLSIIDYQSRIRH